MNRIGYCGRIASVLLLMVGLTLLCRVQPVAANDTFAQQTGLACAACHLPNQEQQGRGGLNPFGLAFLNCGHKLGCQPANATVVHTTQNFTGIATFRNPCTNGQQEFIVLREAVNNAKNDVPLILDPNNHVEVGLSRGSTFAYQCGSMPTDKSEFHWITLDKWVGN